MHTNLFIVSSLLLAVDSGCEAWKSRGLCSEMRYSYYNKPGSKQPTFRVAVFDQGVFTPSPASPDISRQEAVAALTPTLQLFAEQALIAAAKGADMIIFAEYGLLPMGTTRDSVLPYLESIPTPNSSWNPCVDPSRHTNTDIQHFLSCIARNSSLYVVANMGDVVHCGNACPPSGRLQYNTNVVYDPIGVHIARYHKQNLFFESRFDTPTTKDFSYFDTPFGRFGTFVCFDVLFYEPPITLIEQYQIDHVAFTTAWMNVLPYFSAVPFHQSFAIGHGVNFIATNLHRPANRFSGSGIYASNTTIAFRNDDRSTESALLIGDLPANPPKIARKNVVFSDEDEAAWRPSDFQAKVFGDVYNFVRLDKAHDAVMVCHDVTCCHLSYQRKITGDAQDATEHFGLGAFRGLHTREGTYYIEVCAFIKCASAAQESCGEGTKISNTYFSSFNLTGNFTTRYVYPQVTSDGMDPSAGQWEYDGRSITSHDMQKPLLGAIFFSRRYDLDDIAVQSTGVNLRNRRFPQL